MDWNRSGEGQGGPGMLTSRRWHLLRWEKFGGGVGGQMWGKGLKFCFEIRCIGGTSTFWSW